MTQKVSPRRISNEMSCSAQKSLCQGAAVERKEFFQPVRGTVVDRVALGDAVKVDDVHKFQDRILAGEEAGRTQMRFENRTGDR